MALLFDDSPHVFGKNISNALGNDAALFLQQIHYWVQKKKLNPSKYRNSYVNGHWWVYNTNEEWLDQLECLGSPSTFKRLVAKLKELNILVVERHNKFNSDRTNWYRIDDFWLQFVVAQKHIEKLEQIIEEMKGIFSESEKKKYQIKLERKYFVTKGILEGLKQHVYSIAQNDPTEKIVRSFWSYSKVILSLALPYITSEITEEEDLFHRSSDRGEDDQNPDRDHHETDSPKQPDPDPTQEKTEQPKDQKKESCAKEKKGAKNKGDGSGTRKRFKPDLEQHAVWLNEIYAVTPKCRRQGKKPVYAKLVKLENELGQSLPFDQQNFERIKLSFQIYAPLWDLMEQIPDEVQYIPHPEYFIPKGRWLSSEDEQRNFVERKIAQIKRKYKISEEGKPQEEKTNKQRLSDFMKVADQAQKEFLEDQQQKKLNPGPAIQAGDFTGQTITIKAEETKQ